ncbi:hypothetical protein X777_12483 [Ooceraea biroi]|uniref:Uncharacterized protein n=1 Tax=Ooceraea biroi TaxID=2015173 RepID=A0A026VZL9_OOCBI|nr:hypothetical protein X777_12483 [Ooceraea biroi]
MTEAVATLKKQRGLIKSSLTRFKSFLDNYDPNKDAEVLKIRLERAKTLLSAYEDVQLQIEVAENMDDEGSRQLFEERYFACIARAQSLVDQIQGQVNTASNSTIQNITEALSQLSTSAAVESKIKLPTITLPKFSGKYDEWISFEDSFKALVHNNQRMQPVQKFNY